MPIEPRPSDHRFSLRAAGPLDDLVAFGGDLAPGTLLQAYRRGLFPMGLGPGGSGPLGWWSPDPRGILRPDRIRVRRSLRRSIRHLDVTVDRAFADVLAGCADPSRDGRWITPEITEAYLRLHRLGWAHSIEVWAGDDLAGGLYGIAIGGLFAGESMFHRRTDASKAALVALCRLLSADGDPRRVVDVQWCTPHLATLGAVEVRRREYRRLLSQALAAPLPAPWR